MVYCGRLVIASGPFFFFDHMLGLFLAALIGSWEYSISAHFREQRSSKEFFVR